MSQILPYGRQNISEADIEAVCNVLRPDYPTSVLKPFMNKLGVLCFFTAVLSAPAQNTNPSTVSQTLYCMYCQTWYQATNAGLALITSTNYGTNWSSPIMVVTNVLGWSANHAFGCTDGSRLMCIYSTAIIPYRGVWTNIAAIYSDNGGLTWARASIPNDFVWSPTNAWAYSQRTNQPINPQPYGQIRQAGDTLFCGAYEKWTADTGASYVLISTNRGLSWHPRLVSFGTNAASEIEILPVTDDILLAGIRHDAADHNPTILSLSGSIDGGSSWTNLGWMPTARVRSAQNPIALNLYESADGPRVFMAYGDRGSGKLYVSQALLSQVWSNPALLHSNQVAVAAISGSTNADGGYASAVNLDNSGNFLVSYYYAPFKGGYIPASLTNASIHFIRIDLADLYPTNTSGIGTVSTTLSNQYPYEAFPVLAASSTYSFVAVTNSDSVTAPANRGSVDQIRRPVDLSLIP